LRWAMIVLYVLALPNSDFPDERYQLRSFLRAVLVRDISLTTKNPFSPPAVLYPRSYFPRLISQTRC